jgi:hypothetical protein
MTHFSNPSLTGRFMTNGQFPAAFVLLLCSVPLENLFFYQSAKEVPRILLLISSESSSGRLKKS